MSSLEIAFRGPQDRIPGNVALIMFVMVFNPATWVFPAVVITQAARIMKREWKEITLATGIAWVGLLGLYLWADIFVAIKYSK